MCVYVCVCVCMYVCECVCECVCACACVPEKTREGHCQSDERWNCFKGNVGEISEKQDGAYMGFSERINTKESTTSKYNV